MFRLIPMLLAAVAAMAASAAQAAPRAAPPGPPPRAASPPPRSGNVAVRPAPSNPAPAARAAVSFTRDPAGACALKLARAVSLNSTQSASDLAYAITQRCLKDEPLSGTCSLDAKSACETRDDAKFLLLQQIAYKLVLSIRLDDVVARSPK